MNKNVKIAKELVKIARQLVKSKIASKKSMSVDQLAQEIENSVGGDGFSIVLPSGMLFSCEYVRMRKEEAEYDGANAEYETAIVSRTYDGGQPHPEAVWFFDMEYLYPIEVEENENGYIEKVFNARDIAEQVLDADNNIQFKSFNDIKKMCKDSGYFPSFSLLEGYINKPEFLKKVNGLLSSFPVWQAIENVFEEQMKNLLGKYYYDYDFGYDQYSIGDNNIEKFEFLIKLNQLTSDEEAYYEYACECLYYGQGKQQWFKDCAEELGEQRAKEIWGLAFTHMGNEWAENIKLAK